MISQYQHMDNRAVSYTHLDVYKRQVLDNSSTYYLSCFSVQILMLSVNLVINIIAHAFKNE